MSDSPVWGETFTLYALSLSLPDFRLTSSRQFTSQSTIRLKVICAHNIRKTKHVICDTGGIDVFGARLDKSDIVYQPPESASTSITYRLQVVHRLALPTPVDPAASLDAFDIAREGVRSVAAISRTSCGAPLKWACLFTGLNAIIKLVGPNGDVRSQKTRSPVSYTHLQLSNPANVALKVISIAVEVSFFGRFARL